MSALLIVRVPANHLEERKYTINCLLQYILGVPYELEVWDSDYYVVACSNKTIRINDHFWNSFNENCYTEKCLPDVVFGHNQFCKESDIPILYGSDRVEIDIDCIVCDIDVIASSFFMLSRWEEYINGIVDKHNRFPSSESIACKYGFSDRPIVNEYAEMLWNMLMHYKLDLERKKDFRLILTHDIDYLTLPNYTRTIIRKFASDLFKKKHFVLSFIDLIKSVVRDPYDQFDFFMKNSERIEEQAHFYFMAATAQIDEYKECNYLSKRKFKKVVKAIDKRNHVIGFHPSYFSYNDSCNWELEYSRLQKSVKINITEGRQHYLRFVWPTTARIWNKKMTVDSTLGYADRTGFRCGTGNIYPLYDMVENKATNVLEQPLVIMDTTLTYYEGLPVKASEEVFTCYIDIASKYLMPLTVLFHNTSFYGEKWNGWSTLYKRVLDYYYQKKHENSKE